jgi:signal transduction histidine kinase
VRPRRAWIYVLSIAALLVPAGGIAYLGAVSYRDERGAVSAQHARQRAAALALAARIDQAIERALDEASRAVDERAAAPGPGGAAAQRPLAPPLGQHWFYIDAARRLVVPRGAPAPALAGNLERAPCAPGLAIDACFAQLERRAVHVARLGAALRAEARGAWPEARRRFLTAVQEAETAPAALAGLARVSLRAGDAPRAAAALAELEDRHGERAIGLVPVPLVAATLRAQASGPAALLQVAEAVLADRYALDPGLRLGAVLGLRQRVGERIPPAVAGRWAAIDERVAALRAEARAAAGLADDLAEVVRAAGPAWRGRPAVHEPRRTLVFRRRADGGVVGIAVDGPLLEQAAGAPPAKLAVRAQPRVLLAGEVPEPALRTVAQVPLGAALPHLSLAIVNPTADPDPLDEVIRARSRQHVIYTSALAIALGLGLLATIRGAARARELARLKSDFVSTVSHELKTPLTSIRMFAEMLEQGVAQGDPQRQARYHGVIVQESQRLGLLIANLLDYAQIERGTRRYAPSPQAIGALARHAVETFESLRLPAGAARNALVVAVSPAAMSAEVIVDRDVVVQAVLNLLANAAKYGGSERPIEVTADADERVAWIAVRDHGPGIPPSEQRRIFRELYRAPEAYRSGVEGTGLGLALVKRHIEAQGGTVDVASVVGAGATFTIRVPRAAAGAA